MNLPIDPTTYSFTLQSVKQDEYTYTRPDLYILVINPTTQYFLIRYYNINNPAANIQLFRGWISNDSEFITVMNLIKP